MTRLWDARLRTRTQPPSRTRAATRHEAPPRPPRAGLASPHTHPGSLRARPSTGQPQVLLPSTPAHGQAQGPWGWATVAPVCLEGSCGGVRRPLTPGLGLLEGSGGSRVPACCLLGAETACGPGVSRWWVSTLTQVAPGQPELGPTGWGTGPKQPHCCLSFPDHDLRLAFLALTKD